MTTLNTATRSRIVNAFSSAYDAKENTGGCLTQVCEIAASQTLDKEAFNTIAEGVADARKWKDKTRDSRMSEVRVILRAAPKLPDAIAKLAKDGLRDWHTVMKAARKLAKGESMAAAVAFAKESGVAGKKANPKKRAESALKAWFGASRGDTRASIIKAADALGLKIDGVNV